MPKALVIGRGVAGLTCARLLAQQGWEIEICKISSSSSGSPISPTVVLNDITCYLLQDIWQLEDKFWQNFYVLNQRRVRWGMEASVLNIPQLSMVINGNCLVKLLEERLLQAYNQQVYLNESPLIDKPTTFEGYDWVIDAGGRKSAIAENLGKGKRHRFGCRCILSSEVTLTQTSEQNACWMETVADGWIFLAPLGEHRALLQCMVPIVREEPSQMLIDLLEKSHSIKSLVDSFLGSITVFQAFPQILTSLCEPKWIAVGDAAISFDPISGDGTGYAIRGAILATSVINGITSQSLLNNQYLHHYTQRLHKTFLSHLQECLKYYSAAFSSSAWKAEIKLIQDFLYGNKHGLITADHFAYRLNKLNLVPITD
ncbi:MAG: hypothetical protein VKK42_29910 [Lyngbya sp.]|nr:hypothetical protein [Lyngbya sp.]